MQIENFRNSQYNPDLTKNHQITLGIVIRPVRFLHYETEKNFHIPMKNLFRNRLSKFKKKRKRFTVRDNDTLVPNSTLAYEDLILVTSNSFIENT